MTNTMNRNIFRFLLFCSAAFLQLSCASKLAIETTLPAKVPIGIEQWKVVVINRFNPEFLDYEKEEELAAVSTGAHEAFMGAVHAVLEDSTYLLVHSDSANFTAHSKDEKLPAEAFRKIYQQHPYHLLLSLDHFDVGVVEEVEGSFNDTGTYSQETYTSLLAKSTWTLYDSTGTELDSAVVQADDYYPSGTRRQIAQRVVPVIHTLAWYTGFDYWMRLSPSTINYDRPYYAKGKMVEAGNYMASQNWEAAIADLKLIFAEGNKRDAGKAAFNLAVVYEALNAIEEAKRWATEAAKKNNPLAPQLLEILESY